MRQEKILFEAFKVASEKLRLSSALASLKLRSQGGGLATP